MTTQAQKLLPDLEKYAKSLPQNFSEISDERKENLTQIANFIFEKYTKNEPSKLVFICTHNSRRSQFAQVWAKIAANYYGFDSEKIQTYSGGTEVTACNPRTIAALQRAGVQIEAINQISAPITTANNPRYAVFWGEKNASLYLFSKKYKDAQNPQENFCAILVCSAADEACPIVLGAEKRIYHQYEDPKRADNQADEHQIYDKTCRLIATEMFYVFSILSKLTPK